MEKHLYRPEGPGPSPAVVLLHGCSGIIQTERGWAQELRKRGYLALIVDSFRPRGHREICTDFTRVTRSQRVEDAFAGLRWLRAQPLVVPDAVALMGFSNGGYALLQAMASPPTTASRGFQAAARNPNKPGGCCGATVAYDEQAHADALARAARFLAVHLTGAAGR